MPLNKDIKKVLMIGSGPIVIGQAAEFDYAGAQACRVLKRAGVNVVLVNSNPATIMTDKALADEIYLEPLTVETVKRIIEKEKPDSMLAGLGGQTGLTLAMQLDKEGFLEAHGVRLIGTNVEAIDKAEDRQLFKDTMQAIGEPVMRSAIPSSSAPPSPWAAPAAAWLMIMKKCAPRPARGWTPPPSPKFWWKSTSPDGRRSNLRPCGTPPATPSPCAAWKTSIPWASIPGIPSSSPRR